MDDQHGDERDVKPDAIVRTRPPPPSRKGKGPTASSWKPGQSGNPAGRPRSPNAAAEKIRERVDLDRVLDLVDVVLDQKSSAAERADARDRLAVVLPVIDRGYTKPPTGIHATLETSATSGSRSFDHLTQEQLRERLAWIRGETLELDAAPPERQIDELAVSEEDKR